MKIRRLCDSLFLVLAFVTVGHAQIPAASARYRTTVIREAHAQGGLRAPVAMFAGQLTQESHFNPNARSGAGAIGLAQFMPQTSIWLTKVAPKDFPTANALDPNWAIRALIWYDYNLYRQLGTFQSAYPPSDRWAAALSAYNGGIGFVFKDIRLATCDRSLWWNCVSEVTDGRTAANWTQNRNYPILILRRWMPLYEKAGWY